MTNWYTRFVARCPNQRLDLSCEGE